ncbi:MAG: hypothetical protein V2I82_01855 [Halieaceae bacterium]|jgi:hypothetical protein|nr:hypothetical protein [Halieaceae bacterium]
MSSAGGQQSTGCQHEAIFDFEVPGLMDEDRFIRNDKIVLASFQCRAGKREFRRQSKPEAKLHVLAVGKRLVGPEPMGESQIPQSLHRVLWA